MEVSGGYEWEHILHIFHVLVSLLSRVEEAESEIERGKHSLDWYHIHVT